MVVLLPGFKLCAPVHGFVRPSRFLSACEPSLRVSDVRRMKVCVPSPPCRLFSARVTPQLVVLGLGSSSTGKGRMVQVSGSNTRLISRGASAKQVSTKLIEISSTPISCTLSCVSCPCSSTAGVILDSFQNSFPRISFLVLDSGRIGWGSLWSHLGTCTGYELNSDNCARCRPRFESSVLLVI